MANLSTFKLMTKNARINSDARLIGLLCELNNLTWDVICFSETRAVSQDGELSGGHRLISSYKDATSPASGTAILIHARIIKFVRRKIIMHDRVMAIDVKFDKKMIRVISVYVPHAGHAWNDFDDVFACIMIGAFSPI